VAQQYAAYGIHVETEDNGGADWSNPSNHPAMIFASSPKTTAELQFQARIQLVRPCLAPTAPTGFRGD
jgi:hypothetical protein